MLLITVVPLTMLSPAKWLPLTSFDTLGRVFVYSNQMAGSSNNSAGEKFQLLVDLMARLRAPGGCPWDREQNFDTIKPYLLEETYEVLDAIDARDWRELPGELGDLLLQAEFFSQMPGRENPFRIRDPRHGTRQKSDP